MREVAARVFDLFLQLDASDEQAEFEVVYTSALQRRSGVSPSSLSPSMHHLIAALWRLNPPRLSAAAAAAAAAAAGDADTAAAAAAAARSLQLQVANVAEDPYRGRMALGKLQGGALIPGKTIGLIRAAAAAAANSSNIHNHIIKATFTAVYRYEGVELTPVDPLLLQQQQQQQQKGLEGPLDGELVVVGGLSQDVRVGDSLVDLAAIKAEAPTVSVLVMPNSSPLAGQDSGTPTTILSLREKLKALIRNDISAKVSVGPGGLCLSGRGPLHLAVLIENLRRSGLELAVAAPDILPKWDGEQWLEPYEDFELTISTDAMGAALREVQTRHGSVTDMITLDSGGASSSSSSSSSSTATSSSSSNSNSSSSSSSSSSGTSMLFFRVATRFSFGLKAALMEASKGAAILNSSPAGLHALVPGAPVPRAARGPPPNTVAGGGGEGIDDIDDDNDDAEEQLLLQQQQQQQQQQRIPKEGEKQQHSSRQVFTVKKQIEEKQEKQKGFLVAIEQGKATVKGILHAQERGEVFVSPGDEVYTGMLVGLHKRPNDLP
ncbi:GTP-binding protein TypA, putative, partial [Eimeria maxima]